MQWRDNINPLGFTHLNPYMPLSILEELNQYTCQLFGNLLSPIEFIFSCG
jgi:hypothetical protein